MDYSNYEIYDFDHVSSFNMSTGYAERSYKAHLALICRIFTV